MHTPYSSVSSIRSQIYTALSTEAGKLAYSYFMERQYSTNGNKTSFTRSTILFGAPLEGYTTARDRDNQQINRYKELVVDIEQTMFANFNLKSTLFKSYYALDVVDKHVISPSGKLKLKFYSYLFQELEFDRLVNGDLLMTILSIIFVFIWIWTHTESLFLAAVGMGMILMSLPNALFVYKIIFQVPYFVQIHILAIFLVLGIGADDVFVLTDAWKQTEDMTGNEYPAVTTDFTDGQRKQYCRLSAAMGRASQAIFNTSVTTAVAFLATGASPVMPISAFGFFAALAIIFNYIMAMTLLPAAVILYVNSHSLTLPYPPRTSLTLTTHTTSSSLPSTQLNFSPCILPHLSHPLPPSALLRTTMLRVQVPPPVRVQIQLLLPRHLRQLHLLLAENGCRPGCENTTRFACTVAHPRDRRRGRIRRPHFDG
jgi:hypothetical protein